MYGYFDEHILARQDYEMWLRISEKYEIRCAKEFLFYHNMHEAEQISKNPNKTLRAYEYMYEKYKEYYDKNRKARAGIYQNMAYAYFKCEEKKKFVKYAYLCFINNKVKGIKLIYRVMFGKHM